MNILLAHNNYKRFSGEEAAIENIEAALKAHGHKVEWLRRYSADIRDSSLCKARALFSGIYSFNSKRAVRKLSDTNKFDIAQVQNLYPLLSASILPELKRHSIPVVMRCPNYRLFCPTGLHLRDSIVCDECLRGTREWNCVKHNCENNIFKSIGYAARNAFGRITGMIIDNVDIFVVLTEFQRERFVTGGIPRQNIEVLPNPAKIKKADQLVAGGDYVAYAGRISDEKGIHILLAAAQRLPEVTFKLAGSVDKQLQISEVPSNVDFLGFLEGETLNDFYANSRMIVSPSTCFEGFPNSIATAMGHAKPVVASRLGAVTEIIDNDITGILLPPGDAVLLADKISYLWDRPSLCNELGRAGWEKAQRNYSNERFYERLMAIYEKALLRSAQDCNI